VITSNELARDSDANGVGNVSGRKVNDSHRGSAAGRSVLFGAGVALEERPVAAAGAARGGRPVVTEPALCPTGRSEVPSMAHLVLSLALLCFAVAISVL